MDHIADVALQIANGYFDLEYTALYVKCGLVFVVILMIMVGFYFAVRDGN